MRRTDPSPQRSPTDCRESEWDLETLWMMRPWSTAGRGVVGWAKNKEEDVCLTTPTEWTLCTYYIYIYPAGTCFGISQSIFRGNLGFPYSKPSNFTQPQYGVNYCKICCKSDKILSFYCSLQPNNAHYISQQSLCTIYIATCFDIAKTSLDSLQLMPC